MRRIPVYRLMGPEKVEVGEALVDDQDYELVAAREWFVATRYASSKGELMHRVIMGAAPGEAVHHRNRDRLDNRRENLEVFPDNATHRRERHGGPGPRFQKVKPDEYLAKHYRRQ